MDSCDTNICYLRCFHLDLLPFKGGHPMIGPGFAAHLPIGWFVKLIALSIFLFGILSGVALIMIFR
jgi:uncharacterized membrane protein